MVGYNENAHEHCCHGGGLKQVYLGHPGVYDSYKDRVPYYSSFGNPFSINIEYESREPYPLGKTHDSNTC